MALVSSFLNKPVEPETVIFGEIGLAGEIRGVSQVEMRLNEAEKLGFTKCIMPKINFDRLKRSDGSISLIGVDSVESAIEVIFG